MKYTELLKTAEDKLLHSAPDQHAWTTAPSWIDGSVSPTNPIGIKYEGGAFAAAAAAGYEYETPNGVFYTYTPDMIAGHSNALGSGKSVEDMRGMGYNDFMSMYTGTDNYQQAYNDYWKNIPDAQWNKVYRPATQAERSAFTGRTPENRPIGGLSMPMYSAVGGYVSIPDRALDVFSNGSYVFGGEPARTAALYSGLPSIVGEASVRAHEMNHANQLPATANPSDEQLYGSIASTLDGMPTVTLKASRRDEATRDAYRAARRLSDLVQENSGNPSQETMDEWNSTHPVSSVYGKDLGHRIRGAYNPYTGIELEELQAMRALKDGIRAQQKLISEHPERFAQFSREDIDAFMSIDPWFKSPEHAEQAMRTLRQHPAITLTMGPEPIRALDMAQDYDWISDYPHSYEGIPYDEYIRRLEEEKQAEMSSAEPDALDYIREEYDGRIRGVQEDEDLLEELRENTRERRRKFYEKFLAAIGNKGTQTA